MWSLASALPELDFEIVGDAEVTGSVLPNVRVHPLLEPAEFVSVLARSDLALGTLALHRKRMTQAAPLKVREYLAYGLPVVIAYDDPDLRDPFWFVLRLPNCESNVIDNLDTVRRFALDVAGRRVARHLIEDRIDIGAKEARRLEFIAEVAHASRTSAYRSRS